MNTTVIKVNPADPAVKDIAFGAKVLREGGLVAFPTETVYGLGANFLSKDSMERLYEVKRRARNKPFTVHIADIQAIKDMGCAVTPHAQALADKFWPGPLTMILCRADGRKIGFRMPANLVALRLISSARVPIVAPSANISGRVPPKTAGEVMASLDGEIDMVIDGGPADIGVESTVVDMTVLPVSVLREGAIKKAEILKYANG